MLYWFNQSNNLENSQKFINSRSECQQWFTFETLDCEDLVICDKSINWKMLSISSHPYNIIPNKNHFGKIQQISSPYNFLLLLTLFFYHTDSADCNDVCTSQRTAVCQSNTSTKHVDHDWQLFVHVSLYIQL